MTSFRYKAAAHGKGKKAVKPKAAPAPAPAPEAKPNPKVAGLQKRLATARKKLEDAKTAGTPTRVLEDRVYEIEDELKNWPDRRKEKLLCRTVGSDHRNFDTIAERCQDPYQEITRHML